MRPSRAAARAAARAEARARRPNNRNPRFVTLDEAAVEFLKEFLRAFRVRLFGSVLILVSLFIIPRIPMDSFNCNFSFRLEELKVVELYADSENVSVRYNMLARLAATKNMDKAHCGLSQLVGVLQINEGDQWLMNSPEFQFPHQIVNHGNYKVFWNLAMNSTLNTQDERRVVHLKEEINQNNAIPFTLHITGKDSLFRKFEAKCRAVAHPTNSPRPEFSDCQIEKGG